MKLYFSFLAGVTLFVAGCASTVYENSPISSAYPHNFLNQSTPFGDARVVKFYKTKPNTEKVRGVCYITNDPELLVGRPCRNTTFVLEDSSGQEVYRTHTDYDGRFQFTVKMQKRYALKVKSEQFKTASDALYVFAGGEVLVHLIKK